jgi:hypothetical protein
MSIEMSQQDFNLSDGYLDWVMNWQNPHLEMFGRKTQESLTSLTKEAGFWVLFQIPVPSGPTTSQVQRKRNQSTPQPH